MATIDFEFQRLFSKITMYGEEYTDKNRGVKRMQIPSYTFKHSFDSGFPAITLKKLHIKSIVGELLWFLRGDNNIKYLNENGIKIWNKDAYNWYKKNYRNKNSFIRFFIGKELTFEEFNKMGKGSVGRNYSVQWRDFNGTDQIKNLIEGMKENIMSTRLKVNAWNPAELDQTALPPCHSEFQIIGVPLGNDEFGFELHWTQRSVDAFLGLPFNVASYSILAKILEQITGYKALGIEGNLKCVHIYENQYNATVNLLNRNPTDYSNCKIEIPYVDTDKPLDEILSQYKIEDFKLIGYESHPEIKVEMLAPKT